MADKSDLIDIIKDLQRRVEALESLLNLREVKIPGDGKLVVDSQASDPDPEDGRIYYNTTTKKVRVCEDGNWRDA